MGVRSEHVSCCAQGEHLDNNCAVAQELYLRVQLAHVCLTLCNAPRAHAVISAAAVQARQRSHERATACGSNQDFSVQPCKITSTRSCGTWTRIRETSHRVGFLN